jgi:hypothetical protein
VPEVETAGRRLDRTETPKEVTMLITTDADRFENTPEAVEAQDTPLGPPLAADLFPKIVHAPGPGGRRIYTRPHDNAMSATRRRAEEEALGAINYAIRVLTDVHGLVNTLGPAGALARIVKLAEAEVVIDRAERIDGEENPVNRGRRRSAQ